MNRIRVVPFSPPKNKNQPEQKKLSALRNALTGAMLANLNNPDYLRQRAEEYRSAGDKVAWLACMLQAESVARY